MSALLDRLLVPALATGLTCALLFATAQWAEARHAGARAARTAQEFAEYREVQERLTRERLERLVAQANQRDRQRLEALNAEYEKRQAAERVADQLRVSHGQLQRLAADLGTSLADRDAGDAAAPSRCEAERARIGVLADVLGELDRFAQAVSAEADGSRRAGELCERSYEALK